MRTAAERLRLLAQALRASDAEEEARRAQRQRERDAEEARRQELMQQWAILEQRDADRRNAA